MEYRAAIEHLWKIRNGTWHTLEFPHGFLQITKPSKCFFEKKMMLPGKINLRNMTHINALLEVYKVLLVH